uniref:DUF4220 domain-containing protein n=1 Tax=Oryza meridionalis TaxID=40149 RepID=A0A0E0DBB8_9ORYZ
MGIVSVLMGLGNEWAVQALVLFSFTLQVTLLSLAWIRRHSIAIMPKLVLWVAYQLADSTALFTLGHMAISSRSREEQPLMAFWAPFLILHLGGQDNITAYSFKDNRLWLRHLQTLVVLVMGASYVLYKYMPGKETLVMAAAVLIFVVGILKYGERIWALREATFDNIARCLDQQEDYASAREREGDDLLRHVLQGRTSMDEENVLIGAHGLLDICRGLFIGSRGGRRGYLRHVLLSFQMYGYKLMEMELSLMYDILYTKATVIHTWIGCCIRVIALAATVTATFLFLLSSKHGHSRKDLAVPYVLLAGALLLEMISMVRAVLSTWTVVFLYKLKWYWLYGEVLSIRRVFRVATHRRWSGTVGQHNFLWASANAVDASAAAEAKEEPPASEPTGYYCLDTMDRCCWHRTKLSDSTKEQIMRRILEMHENRQEIGSQPGVRAFKALGLDGSLGWRTIQDIGFEDSIMAWHLASDICLFSDRSNKLDLHEGVAVLSNYMMFLLVHRRYMLPGPDLFEWALRRGLHDHLNSDDPPAQYDTGVRLAAVLYHRLDRLDIIFGVWVEMLCYVACNCSRESHARQLSSGGELVTIVWLMARLVDMS